MKSSPKFKRKPGRGRGAVAYEYVPKVGELVIVPPLNSIGRVVSISGRNVTVSNAGMFPTFDRSLLKAAASPPSRQNHYAKLLKLAHSKGSKTGEPSNPTGTPETVPKREGFIYRGPGRWEYDHRQDTPQLEKGLRKAKADEQRRRERNSKPIVSTKRYTIANAPRDVVIEALHKAMEKKKRREDES